MQSSSPEDQAQHSTMHHGNHQTGYVHCTSLKVLTIRILPSLAVTEKFTLPRYCLSSEDDGTSHKHQAKHTKSKLTVLHKQQEHYVCIPTQSDGNHL